ncbi:MAG: tetratricopeptide repeat protein, partial [candidate division WOR-3 bacterium]
ILARLGKLDSAINHYQTALVRDPKYGLAHYNLGRAYEARGEFTQAEAEYREAARLMPDYSAVQQDLERLSRRH